MNKLIKSIHEQIDPDKRIVDDLLEKINGEYADEVKSGSFKRIWLTIPAAAVCAVICAGVFMNLKKEEPPTEKITSASAVSEHSPETEKESLSDIQSQPEISSAVTDDSQTEISVVTNDSSAAIKAQDTIDSESSHIVTSQQAAVPTDDSQTYSDNSEQPDEPRRDDPPSADSSSESNSDTKPEIIVETAEYIVDNIYKSDEDHERKTIAMVVSDSYRQQIMEKANTIRYDHKDYICTGEIRDSIKCGKAIADGRLIVNGEITYSIIIYETGDGSANFSIAVDIGDWKAIVYEAVDNTIVGDTVSSAVCSLSSFEDPDEIQRTGEIIAIEETYKQKILEKLNTVKFNGKEYVWSGETIDSTKESLKWIGGGTLTVDGDMVFDTWVYEVNGVSSDKAIALDIGDWEHCKFVLK